MDLLYLFVSLITLPFLSFCISFFFSCTTDEGSALADLGATPTPNPAPSGSPTNNPSSVICTPACQSYVTAFNYSEVNILMADKGHIWSYGITGIFCGCLIFAEFCGCIEIAEIKNRKIFQSRYNDEIMSEDIVQLRVFRCLSGIVVELSE